MVDWFYVVAGVVVVCQVVLGCCCLCSAALVLATLAVLRFAIIPADCDATLWFYQKFGHPVEKLRGQVVWITGASSGIGAALAVRLAKAGVRLVISARSTQGLEEVKRLCVATGGVKDEDVLVLSLDMTHYHLHQSSFDTVISHFGQLDILVCNAGRSQRANWVDIDTEVDKALFDVNVFSLISLSRIAVRYFFQRGRGHVAVTSSTAGKLGAPQSASYTASKHALHGYFETLRTEHGGRGVNISMICPGPVKSSLLTRCFTDKLDKKLVKERKDQRMMSSERCAELFAITLANSLSEVWIALQPVLSFYYILQYFPDMMKWVLAMIPTKFLMKLRDGHDVMQSQAKQEKAEVSNRIHYDSSQSVSQCSTRGGDERSSPVTFPRVTGPLPAIGLLQSLTQVSWLLLSIGLVVTSVFFPCPWPCTTMPPCPWYYLVVVVVLVLPVWGFNLEPRESHIFSYPEEVQIALQKQHVDGPAWLVVGAPRANSSLQFSSIIEPGAVFKCPLQNQGQCQELFIKDTGVIEVGQGTNETFLIASNHGWLGGYLDTQPTYQNDRQTTVVCAPRWINSYDYGYIQKMTGACFYLDLSLGNMSASKLRELDEIGEDALGQMGFAVHFPDDPSEVLFGVPNYFKGRGTMAKYKDRQWNLNPSHSRRRRRQSSLAVRFTTSIIPKPIYTPEVEEDDYMGYAITSGNYSNSQKLLYAAGSPKANNTLGEVIIFSFPEDNALPLAVVQVLVGKHFGGNFGSALTSPDINGDGLSDLVVGVPMFSDNTYPDMGAITVYLSSQGELVESSDHYGAGVSLGRFGTTLTSLGDLNADGYEDICVGAPFEESGAVYIFLGSAGGLRTTHSQRLVPEHFTGTPAMKGFGMALSRGIDVDDNAYPDLAIGSFLSGHAVVIRSRPVAKLESSITTTPPSITVEDKHFTMAACIQYGGHKVPTQLDIIGTITLDPLLSRTVFNDTKTQVRGFNHTLTLNGTNSNCLNYNVGVKQDEPINPHEPIVITLDYEVAESLTQPYVSQPIADPTTTKSVTFHVKIVTGCETDGNDMCHTDLRLETGFLLTGSKDKLVIGSENPVFEVNVYNEGEPAYLPNMTVKVEPPMALFLPSTHNCNFSDPEQRTSLVCRLSNPISKDKQDTVQVTLDGSQLTDTLSEVGVRVSVMADGMEVQPQDNIVNNALQLEAQPDLRMHGYSQADQIQFALDEKGNINSTGVTTVKHTFAVLKEGPTPVGQMELNVTIPIRFRSTDQNFVHIFNPVTSFMEQRVSCQLFGAEFAVGSSEDQSDSHGTHGLETTGKPDHMQPQHGEGRERKDTWFSSRKIGGALNCSRVDVVECARISCSLDSWPRDTTAATIELGLAINMTILSWHMSPETGIVLQSTARAVILSFNPHLTFTGKRTATIQVGTQIQPESPLGAGVPWWVILLAVLGGLLLLGLLAYGLYKAGFFHRKEQEEMKSQRARVQPAATSEEAET
ncbi:hypothetical protein Pcinc_012280 [Petrolisthes cinctipes]|uniref:Ketoreductase domain-containing protein n=1 Tax=Petrolisthes cinctipes TaxID=88211 RepID=A0AAE1KVJ7_PETCI|nr:hypothetical protein Pcinc_012280 [Petrolisthes cinctipes]